MTVSAFPLAWPQHRPRTAHRRNATFNTKVNNGRYIETKALTVAAARDRLQRELDRLGAKSIVLSTNVELRLDGLPRSGQAEPKDPGVALYFMVKGKPHCLPCDTYSTVADNIAALAAHIEASRKIERLGVADLGEIFAGFVALPPPKHWSEILGVPRTATVATVNDAYRGLAKKRHPDRGGSQELMAELNLARDAAVRDIEGTSP
ncbi:J domain-containing protein [Phreatobacter oligotrophus]|uniref:DnaJ-like protein n=1 Tax=Phreatobacter oligotrophus TaxID=1122261 RepID=A0A2T4ZIR0_9HYPH|nr:J domain-containing protein [Phreatobacter oligotrophus]PTM61870.1 DnaJ-like protein [Phreatobacter oligotrophus]